MVGTQDIAGRSADTETGSDGQVDVGVWVGSNFQQVVVTKKGVGTGAVVVGAGVVVVFVFGFVVASELDVELA